MRWIKALWATRRGLASAISTALVVVALAGTLYGFSLARQTGKIGTTGTQADTSATATSTQFTTPTLTPPLSGPTPTAIPGGHPIATSTGTDPFMVTSVSILSNCTYTRSPCEGVAYCTDTPPSAPPYGLEIEGYASIPPNAPDGYITYRWHLSDGTVTAPATAHLSVADTYHQNVLFYYYLPAPAHADGSDFWAQLEIMKPNEMISLRSQTYNYTCLPWVYSATSFGPTAGIGALYDCAQGGVQAFPYEASFHIAASPSFPITYYWKRPDGSVSPTTTIYTTAGATSVTLPQDNGMVLTDQMAAGRYGDVLMIVSPQQNGFLDAPIGSGADITKFCGPTATATATATIAPTATAIIAPTATP